MTPFTLVLDAPGKNSLSTVLMESILTRLDEAKNRPILLVGQGDAFCAGLNLKEVASLDAPSMETFVRLVEDLMVRLFDHPAPTIACVNGHAIAGGCILTLCCDYRVCTDAPSVRVGVNEVALGLTFPPKISRIVECRVPPRALHEVVLRSRLYSPQDALRLGLVDELAVDPRACAEERMLEFAALPRDAYASSKRALHQGVTAIDDKLYASKIAEIMPIWTHESVRERVQKQLAKR